MPIALTQSSLSVPLLMAQGIPGDYLTQSLWKAPGPPVPLSCAQGPLGGRKQCIVMLASRTSCSDPGARQVFVKTLPESPVLPGQGEA